MELILKSHFFFTAQNIPDGLGTCPNPIPANGIAKSLGNALPNGTYANGTIALIDCDEGFNATRMPHISFCEEHGLWTYPIECVPNDQGQYSFI